MNGNRTEHEIKKKTPKKRSLTTVGLYSALALPFWPLLVVYGALGHEHAFRYGYNDLATNVLFYYPIPILIGIIGENRTIKRNGKADIVYTGIAGLGLISLLSILVFVQKW